MCRGYGIICCPSETSAAILLNSEHMYEGRTLIIERMKTANQLAQKYDDLKSRKVKVLIRLPSSLSWDNASFRNHFSEFGDIQSAFLKLEPVDFYKNRVLMGNIIYKRP